VEKFIDELSDADAAAVLPVWPRARAYSPVDHAETGTIDPFEVGLAAGRIPIAALVWAGRRVRAGGRLASGDSNFTFADSLSIVVLRSRSAPSGSWLPAGGRGTRWVAVARRAVALMLSAFATAYVALVYRFGIGGCRSGAWPCCAGCCGRRRSHSVRWGPAVSDGRLPSAMAVGFAFVSWRSRGCGLRASTCCVHLIAGGRFAIDLRAT